MGSYRIVLADDHAMLRQGLRRIIGEVDGFEVIGEAGDGLELLSLLGSVTPDMVILDISMPNVRGFEAVRSIVEIHPDARVLVLTMHKDVEYVSGALSAGAHGYLLKEDADRELFLAIEKIRGGGIYLSPRLSDGLAEEWARMRSANQKSPLEPLTLREREVLKLIAEGRSNRDIAEILCISVRTVERHRANIMNKLELRNTAELVKYALRKGYA